MEKSDQTKGRMNFTIKLILAITTVVFLSSNLIFAQLGGEKDIVKIKSYQSMDKVVPGSEFKIAVQANIKNGWHINSDKPKDEFLIPTELSISGDTNFTIENISYPEPQQLKFAFSDNKLSVWEGEVLFGALVKTTKNLSPGDYPVIVKLDYQSCNNMTCLAPTSVEDTMHVIIAEKNAAVNEINPAIFQKVNLSYTAPTISNADKSDDVISSALKNNGLLIGLLFVFIGGLALNLTPCVYPLIPITIGFFGGQSEGRTSRLILMGLLFVIGLSVTYSVIGVVTALSGSVFGSLMQNTYVILAIVVIFVVLSLSMFGVYEIAVPSGLMAKAGGAKSGYYGAFFMGLTMGIVAAPCIGPFVLGLVTFVAAKGDPFFGFLLFFVLALGLGFPYLLLAIFSGKIKALPRAGEWMDAVKHIFGFILLGMAFYFLLPLIPKPYSSYILPVYMIIAALYILFVDKLSNNVRGFRIFKTAFSIILVAVAVWMLIPNEKTTIKWQPYSKESITSSQQTNNAVIIDFYADWCIPCKELDASTFTDPKVIKESERFHSYKANMTKSLSPAVESLRDQYKIVGVPTVLILNSQGKEVKRITGYVNAKEFYNILSTVN